MSKFVFLFAAVALLHVVSAILPCNCGCGSAYPIGSGSYYGGLGSPLIGGAALPAYSGSSLIGGGSLIGGAALPAYTGSSLIGGGSLIGGSPLIGGYSGLSGLGCGGITYPGRVGLSCTPVTSCTTGTCTRPVTVCRQAWQSYPCSSCSTGLSCTPTCSC